MTSLLAKKPWSPRSHVRPLLLDRQVKPSRSQVAVRERGRAVRGDVDIGRAERERLVLVRQRHAVAPLLRGDLVALLADVGVRDGIAGVAVLLADVAGEPVVDDLAREPAGRRAEGLGRALAGRVRSRWASRSGGGRGLRVGIAAGGVRLNRGLRSTRGAGQGEQRGRAAARRAFMPRRLPDVQRRLSATPTVAAGLKLVVECERLGLPMLHRTRVDGYVELFVLEALDDRLTIGRVADCDVVDRRRPGRLPRAPGAGAARRRMGGRGPRAVAQRDLGRGLASRRPAALGGRLSACGSGRPCSRTAPARRRRRRPDGDRRPATAAPAVTAAQRAVLVALVRPMLAAARRRPRATRDRLGAVLSPETVRSHIKDLYERFGLEAVAPAAKRGGARGAAVRLGVVEPRRPMTRHGRADHPVSRHTPSSSSASSGSGSRSTPRACSRRRLCASVPSMVHLDPPSW